MASNSFMSGLINGFMSFGGAGAMGSMGGAGASATGSPTGNAAMTSSGGMNVNGTMANINNQTVTGPTANPGGSATNANPGAGNPPNVSTGQGLPSGSMMPGGPSGGENVGKTSQALSSDSSGGDIVRTNPYGEGGVAKSGPTADEQKLYKGLSDAGKEMSSGFHGGATMPGGTYGALFGSSGFGGPSSGGAPQLSVPNITPAMSAPMMNPAPQVPMMAPQAPAPMQIPMMAPQPMQTPPPALAMSDLYSKKNIYKAGPELNKFLQSIYNNLKEKK